MPPIVAISVESRRRIQRARSWLATKAGGEEILILGANIGAVNDLVRIQAADKQAAFGWHRLTLAQLAATIAMPVLTEHGLASVSRLGNEAIVARLVHRFRSDGGLGRYEAVAGTPGLPRALAGVMAELRLARLAPDNVASVDPDLARFLTAYLAELTETSLTDWAGVLAMAANGAPGHRLSGLPA
jgi:ATP-dependent helicase/nuclease subunit B